MLILTRRIGETIVVLDANGNKIAEVTVLGVQGNQVRIGTVADKEIAVHREEIHQRILAETKQELRA